MAKIAPLPDAVLQDLCAVLGATDGGLTNREIHQLLAEADIEDPNPPPKSRLVYQVLSKRDRLLAALQARQQRDAAANGVLGFVETAMHPARFRGRDHVFEEWRSELNETLAFVGLVIGAEGKVAKRASTATTRAQARQRATRLRRQLQERTAHSRVLAACGTEIRDNNYFRAVLEAAKSLREEIRARSRLTSDGIPLIDQAFERRSESYPVLAFNKLETETDWSEHRGLTNLLRGVVGAMRNPTAHEPRWPLSEQEALDMLSVISFLHGKLDNCWPTGQAQAATAASAGPTSI